MNKNYILKTSIAVRCLAVFLMIVFSTNFSEALAQSKTISGTVSDNYGMTLPGVSVLIKGSTQGTVTDLEGKYVLTSDGDIGTLVFSYIGYTTQEVVLGNQNVLDITLEEDLLGLDEVVVVGYGVQQKKDITGATSSISKEDMNQGAITNPLQQISGRAAGVNITQIGSEPGSRPTVRIRGITSLIGGSDPLVVIDGVQGNLDLLNQVPPSEIESIDVLKDASATAIYGSRGAPGVIIVSTKRSKSGQATIEYTGSVSVDQIANELEVLDAEGWREQARIWNVPFSEDHGSDTDWYDILTQTGMTQNHTVALGGGSQNFNYRASVSAILQDGVVINSSNKNYIASISATQKAIDDRLTMTFTMNNSIRQNIGSPGGVGRAGFTSNLISNAYVSKPTDPVLFENGDYFFDPNVFQYINPYAVAETIINERESRSQFTTFRTDFEIIDGLKAGWFGSWRKVDVNSGYYAPAASTLAGAIDQQGIANVNTNLTDEKLMDISLAYDKDFGKHKINAIGVYEWQRQTYQGHFAQTKGFINDLTEYHALQLGSVSRYLPGDISSYKNDRTLVSFLGRVNYSFADKYILTASMRRDGSSVFGEEHKWGHFPSVSAAWRIGDEGFMQGQNLVSTLKLRAGYGITGNQQGLSPQQSLQLVGASGSTYFNGGLITNFQVTQNANQNLQWETRRQTNVGIDFGFAQDKINGTIDVYTATTDNLLFNYAVPQPPYPFGSIAANVGSLRNDGLELALNYHLLDNSDWSITLAGNVTFMRNEVERLSGTIGGVEVNTNYVGWGFNSYLIEGQPIGTFYILENDGKESGTNEELVVDRNGDGVIDQGNESPDRYIAGTALPTFTYAFTPTVKFKNFDLSMVWRGSGGNMIFNRIRRDFSLYESLGKSNMLVSAENLGLFTSQYASDLWLEKGDYVRFENLAIGYTFNTAKIRNISSMRLSVVGNNLALFTKYSGLDPELNLSGGNGSGLDAGIYPRTRSIAVGLHVSF
ncbi:iron complex outermembrane recepter protein [Algoriphagus locisalis]|uniref:Iron complex outermembrane recepter protein n=1 Tax=Algoriphagus locisalis TaxID=305507 RepID=A0A1I7E975_9BACT|nr:SusC/RagA family TonB-linked outer membrane protein [Algoriphagus locisalis]SFU20474.1 iron complex outermembrane recepter protein [Algoriphagus locisalis]